ncbi:UDP-N-acetylglucosamine 1-carboxyvinyltransferase, partial [Flavobacteriales bacterium]|nr:UDP-N-acetylglucosamine 1-carboxyvinyltransferase [Flavobacteriales bacterium]
MGSFQVRGGNRLKGDITPQGAKNEALQIISAVLLTAEKVTIDKVPNIRDVNKLIDLLRDLGVKVEKIAPETYTFQADDINIEYLSS